MGGNGTIGYRLLLDAIPMPAFVVGPDVRILDMNRNAREAFGLERKSSFFKKRGGEALNCLHAKDSPAGCGRGPKCEYCVVRSSATEALAGNRISKRRSKFITRGVDGSKHESELIISANPIEGVAAQVLLILQDITELSRLRFIVPICCSCKQVRDDSDYWQSVESYFNEYSGVDFTHGICPKCMHELYPEYEK